MYRAKFEATGPSAAFITQIRALLLAACSKIQRSGRTNVLRYLIKDTEGQQCCKTQCDRSSGRRSTPRESLTKSKSQQQNQAGEKAEKPNWTADESRSAEPKSPECGPADINSRGPQSALLSQVCSRQAKKSYASLLVFFLPFGVLVAAAAVSAPPGGAATMSPDS